MPVMGCIYQKVLLIRVTFRSSDHPTSYMPVTPPNLEYFPNSAYARELRGGSANMRFEAALEAAYRIVHLRRVRLRVRIWHSINLVLALLFTADQVQNDGVSNAFSVAHWSALLPSAVALFWLSWSRRYERFYLAFASVLTAVFGALIGAFVAFAIFKGKSEQLASLTIILFGAFFFAGLLFRQALVSAVIPLVTFASAAYAAGLPPLWLLKTLTIMAVAGAIAAIVYRDVEQSYRRNFLEAAFIGELVVRDGLSGLINRRAFDEHLARVWQQAIREQRSVALLMIDVDHFKLYNDRWGHQAGDMVLRMVAKVVQEFARRPMDLAARYGGEEFAVILYDLTFSHVHFLADRLRETVQDLALDAEIPTGQQITVSVGIGFVTPGIGRSAEGVVQLADEALYEAKAAGRNCIIAKGAEQHVFLITGSFNKADKVTAA